MCDWSCCEDAKDSLDVMEGSMSSPAPMPADARSVMASVADDEWELKQGPRGNTPTAEEQEVEEEGAEVPVVSHADVALLPGKDDSTSVNELHDMSMDKPAHNGAVCNSAAGTDHTACAANAATEIESLARFNGTWRHTHGAHELCTIGPGFVSWSVGCQTISSQIKLVGTDDLEIETTLDGKTYRAHLVKTVGEDSIQWDDGDVWMRSD
eukprot:NODE_20137_length_811_cov_5.124269.p1 GENE.NODE_20137_length_811_cov_5.124269~~NODE_20137_length_811_cov_5.124269.p1  ORF type:complete len:210 (-),score=37.29 NODE_20137_length_811_cov_5.124269:47-676(-)